MAYAGLETLFQNLGPAQASYISGQREGTARGLDEITAQKQMEDILKAQEENRQAQIMNPLAAQFEQGRVAKQGAELPGLFAQSRSLTNKADTEDATKESTIAKTNSANELAVQGDRLKQMTTRQQAANQIVSQIIAQGPVAGEAYRRQLEAQNPELKQMLGNIPTAQLAQAMAHSNQWLMQQDEKYRQAMEVAKMQKESHLAGIAMQNKNRLDLEDKQSENGKYQRRQGMVMSIQERLMGAKNAKHKAEILEEGYYQAQSAGDKELADQLKQRALEARARAFEDKPVSPDRADLPQLGVPVAPKPVATAPIAGSNAPKISDADLINKYLPPKK